MPQGFVITACQKIAAPLIAVANVAFKSRFSWGNLFYILE